MKKLLFTIFLMLFLFSGSAFSQEETVEPFISIGPSMSLKAGVNAVNTPNGRQNGISFNSLPDFGIQGFMPLGETNSLGILFDIGLSSYYYKIKAYGYLVEGAVSDVSYQHNYSYMTMSASLFFKGFLFGFTYGMPMAAEYGAKIDIGKISPMAEFTTGAILPVFADETGILNLHFRASYMLTGIFNNFAEGDPLKDIVKVPPPDRLTNDANPRAASVAVGFSYLFNIY